MPTAPHFIALDLAGVCNFRCTTCVLDTRYPDPVLARWEVIEALADVLPSVGGVALGCNAEPMMHPDAAAIAAWIRARTPGRMLVITNASHLEGERAAALLDAGIDELAVSVDGESAETFEAIRVRADFAAVMRNVSGVARRARGAGAPSLTVIFTSLRANVDELPAVLERAAEWGAARLVVNGYEPYGEGRIGERLWHDPDEEGDEHGQARTEALFRAVAARGRELGVTVALPELVRRAATTCNFVTPVIGPQGAVSPCPALSYAREVPLAPRPIRYPRRVFGTLPERTFEEIWNDPAYVAFREQATCGAFRESACSECLVATGVICPK